MSGTTAANFLGVYRYGNANVTHYGIEDGRGNILPACGTRLGRYALPWHSGPEVTCKKCQTL